MSLIRRDVQFRCQSRDWLGTFWAHLGSTEVNSGESQFMSFRSSVRVRLSDQHPETGSIPGSSTTEGAGQGTQVLASFLFHQHLINIRG
jgi:hypothetical protein